KTDTLGNIDGCEVFPTCLKSTDVSIEVSELVINEMPAYPLFDSTELVFRDSVVRFADFCDIPPSPSPEFVLPDTVCVGACVEATDLNNHFAHGVAWELEGENLHEIRSDSLEFRQCFSQPGAYTVRQRVWFLGCVYEYEKTLTVLDDLRLSFDLEKEILCQPPPAQVKVQGNRPLSDVAWNTGAAGETIFPNTGGQYRATATDGYCQARDSFQIAFLNELISPDEALHIPDDTVVCEAHLPFALRPESSVATDFTLENQNGRQFDLREPGRYTVRAEVYGCPVEKPFELKTDRCDSKIYLPTAFSPNSDGINDDFAPQGKDFTTLELLIFDRWGGLIHRSEGVAAGWDGKTASGASAPLGVYSFKLTYLNTLLNKQEEVQGDVTVLR
ncbi:MAG TPA: gliding motility-associated C-terminal domain-containing protein, partial [Saprospiraceae bacterium]|nr:gliding motility-associated C-terminal domain-containing protein [Saprospiraceae bacterium]